jgi:hypothetical protein
VTFAENQSNHLVVLHNNRYYSFPVLEKGILTSCFYPQLLDEKGVWTRISNGRLAATFKKILEDNSATSAPVGILTTDG